MLYSSIVFFLPFFLLTWAFGDALQAARLAWSINNTITIGLANTIVNIINFIKWLEN